MPKFAILQFQFDREYINRKLNELGERKFKTFYSEMLKDALIKGKYNHVYFNIEFETKTKVRSEISERTIRPGFILVIAEYEEVNEKRWEITNLECTQTGVSIPLSKFVKVKEINTASQPYKQICNDVEHKVSKVRFCFSDFHKEGTEDPLPMFQVSEPKASRNFASESI